MALINGEYANYGADIMNADDLKIVFDSPTSLYIQSTSVHPDYKVTMDYSYNIIIDCVHI